VIKRKSKTFDHLHAPSPDLKLAFCFVAFKNGIPVIATVHDMMKGSDASR
jgi:hypothetical protein